MADYLAPTGLSHSSGNEKDLWIPIASWWGIRMKTHAIRGRQEWPPTQGSGSKDVSRDSFLEEMSKQTYVG